MPPGTYRDGHVHCCSKASTGSCAPRHSLFLSVYISMLCHKDVSGALVYRACLCRIQYILRCRIFHCHCLNTAVGDSMWFSLQLSQDLQWSQALQLSHFFFFNDWTVSLAMFRLVLCTSSAIGPSEWCSIDAAAFLVVHCLGSFI
jgi:hypothetical protein